MSKKAILLAVVISGICNLPEANKIFAAPESSEGNTQASPVPANSPIANELNKARIIESLKAIRKNPGEVKFLSAMCYDMVMPPPETTFVCPDCGENISYQTQSFPGKVADRITTLERSFKNLPVKILIDSTRFCTKCCKTPDAELKLILATSCLECGKDFSWDVKSGEDLENLKFLFINFQAKEINIGEMGTPQISPENLAEFISDKFFCPECLKKLELK